VSNRRRTWTKLVSRPLRAEKQRKPMLVEDVMTRDVVTLTPQQTLMDAINLLRRERIRHLPVVEGPELRGIVTDRDVKRATPSVLAGIGKDEYDNSLQTITVGQLMTRDPITVPRRSPLKSAVQIFINTRVGALPVVDDGRLVGILTDIDVLRVAHDLLPD
jgi:acetoin utilization protein AcuB